MGHMELDLLIEARGAVYFSQGVAIPIASEEAGSGIFKSLTLTKLIRSVPWSWGENFSA